MIIKAKNINEIEGTVKAPPSKSYSHRAIILSSIANGTSKIHDLLFSNDVLSSIRACKALGAQITEKDDYIEVVGAKKLHNKETAPIKFRNNFNINDIYCCTC